MSELKPKSVVPLKGINKGKVREERKKNLRGSKEAVV